jgi:hypothetical protein
MTLIKQSVIHRPQKHFSLHVGVKKAAMSCGIAAFRFMASTH